jgi:hypothetical protein
MQKKKEDGIDPFSSWSNKRRAAHERKKAEKNRNNE